MQFEKARKFYLRHFSSNFSMNEHYGIDGKIHENDRISFNYSHMCPMHEYVNFMQDFFKFSFF
jgi:hypothetical protein